MSDISLSKAVRSNLLSLQNTAQMMSKTQERLATGNKVNSALDNPTNFFTASALNSRAGDMSNLLDSMASGIKTIEAANNGLTSITKTVESMQSTLRQARQDKSFQTATYDVTNASTITVNGGQYNASEEISLHTNVPGVNASLTTVAAGSYLGATSSAASAEGAGARTLITNGGGIATGNVLTVAGVSVTAGADVTDAGLATTIQTALDAAPATVGKYTVTAGAVGSPNAGKIIVESVDPTAASAAVTFGAGATAAVKGTTSFNYSAITSSVTVGGQSIATGATYDDFVTNLQAGATAGGYTVTADATTKNITLTNTAFGATAPTVSGVPTGSAATAASNVIDLTGSVSAAGENVVIDGVTLTTVANANADDVGNDLVTKIGADALLNAKYTATYNTTTKALTLTAKTAGATTTATIDTTGLGTPATSDAVAFTNGADAVNGTTSTVGIVGSSTAAVAAAKDEFTVSYDGKTAAISIASVKGGVGSPVNALDVKNWQDATIASVNAQLVTGGITGVEAKFDAAGKFSIVAKSAEAKTIAIAGTDATAIFGSGTVSTGSAAQQGYSSTGTVDKFVEEINRSQAGKLRASNDNGKLRIENLSTQALDVSFDADGAGVGTPVTSSIAGNSVRDNLSKQFNELRDQLDKLSDDASFNGINLLRGDELTITFNESGSSLIKIQNRDANGNARSTTAANLDIAGLSGEDLDTDVGIDKLLGKLSAALGSLRSQASSFGSNLSSVENRQNFTKNMINTLETGAANLTLADTNEEAANLLALQTRQQLASSALSMASQADQAVLRLFG